MNQLGELAYNIWDTEFGDHTSSLDREKNVLLISGYLEANLGELNVLINTDFKLNKGEDKVVPELKQEENAIFTHMYMKDYLQKQGRNVLKNATATAGSTQTLTDWTELREGDSYIKRSIASSTTKNISAKLFYDLSKEARENLEKLVHAYNMYGSSPIQIEGEVG